ncbi:lycopene cyclase domain-containing protein [Tenacibaculum piscium]|uniref:Lycopene cyclase n=1 Tax=Tenacibaculum piscium TaxID=1458515 RepID=A0A2H1YHV8_9FLAO|nr:lycopene cyclase domain-containing protein [Tenacibaculum piscium]MBE7629898.1 lycopene cyclase domain-containing protein [Tenacibaculum piscium]MBE7670310.1 lycopene cyclase domain-containing protein [Tenacibaculum piscium]SOS75092.1 Lycopene cyclase [Tenacibaculum piscium]
MSEYLYLILNLGSLSVPLAYSVFEKKFHFIQHFKSAFISISLVALPFIIWDVFFTKIGVWGFNPDYYLGIKLLEMPIEEWLFFFCIPYACLFTHEVLKYLAPQFKLSKTPTVLLSFLLILITFLLLIFNFGKWYTTVNFILFIVLMLFSLKNNLSELQAYFPSFLVILIPFLLTNGILTGSFIDAPVVWYNNAENLNFRIFTIPFEDAFYAFTLLFSVQLIFNYLKKSHIKLKDETK